MHVADDGPGRALVVDGATPELTVLPRALAILEEQEAGSPGTWFVDVGANIGTTVVPALVLHGFDKALAIEPEHENVRVLRANLALNLLTDRVHVVAAAASDQPGTAPFRRGKPTSDGWRAGAGSLAGTKPASFDETTVDVVSLDLLLEEQEVAPGDVGLLWLDVQGHEGNVFEGARRLLEKRPPVVFALRPRKLAKAGTLETTLATIAETYTHVVDLRPEGAGHEWTQVIRPAAELREIAARRQTTDVLAFAASDSARATSSG